MNNFFAIYFEIIKFDLTWKELKNRSKYMRMSHQTPEVTLSGMPMNTIACTPNIGINTRVDFANFLDKNK